MKHIKKSEFVPDKEDKPINSRIDFSETINRLESVVEGRPFDLQMDRIEQLIKDLQNDPQTRQEFIEINTKVNHYFDQDQLAVLMDRMSEKFKADPDILHNLLIVSEMTNPNFDNEIPDEFKPVMKWNKDQFEKELRKFNRTIITIENLRFIRVQIRKMIGNTPLMLWLFSMWHQIESETQQFTWTKIFQIFTSELFTEEEISVEQDFSNFVECVIQKCSIFPKIFTNIINQLVVFELKGRLAIPTPLWTDYLTLNSKERKYIQQLANQISMETERLTPSSFEDLIIIPEFWISVMNLFCSNEILCLKLMRWYARIFPWLTKNNLPQSPIVEAFFIGIETANRILNTSYAEYCEIIRPAIESASFQERLGEDNRKMYNPWTAFVIQYIDTNLVRNAVRHDMKLVLQSIMDQNFPFNFEKEFNGGFDSISNTARELQNRHPESNTIAIQVQKYLEFIQTQSVLLSQELADDYSKKKRTQSNF